MTAEWSAESPLDLETPIMLVAFEGWNDAADVATGAIEHLELSWEATQIVEIGGDDYFDYLEQRPVARHRGGVSRSLEWPAITVSTSRPADCDHDIVLVRGPEPALKWRRFSTEFIDLVDSLEITQVVLLGAYLADIPHTRPVPLTGMAFSRGKAADMGIRSSDYEGPTGITGVLQHVLTEAGVPTMSVWAAVPHYVAAPPNPKGTAAVLEWLTEHLDIPISVEQMRTQAHVWEDRVNAAANDDEDLQDYINALEDRVDGNDAEHDPEPDRGIASRGETMPLVDGESIAAEFERFLRGDTDGRGA